MSRSLPVGLAFREDSFFIFGRGSQILGICPRAI